MLWMRMNQTISPDSEGAMTGTDLDDVDFGFDSPPPRPPVPAAAGAGHSAFATRGQRKVWPRKIGGKAKPGKALYIDPIPRSAWFSNLRSELTKEEWEQVKKYVFRKAGYCCEICEGQGPRWPVEAHERWRFDEQTGVQTLADIEALCPDCHESTHYGYARVRGREKETFKHLCKVNDWTPPQALHHVHQAGITWHRLSAMEWVLDARLLLELPIKLSDSTRETILLLAENAVGRLVTDDQQSIMDNYEPLRASESV